MPAERVPMRCVREILRLKYDGGASDRAIARSTGLARSTVSDYLARAAVAGCPPNDAKQKLDQRALATPADFNRKPQAGINHNRWPTSARNDRPKSSESARGNAKERKPQYQTGIA